jgi:hypothetical protein
VWVWASLGLLLALLGIRAWVVESGHASLGRTPVRVKVLTGACALALALVAGSVAVNGGARLVYLLLHPAEAQALEDAAQKAADASTAPPPPPAPGNPAPDGRATGAPTPSAVPAAPPAGR